MRKRFLLFLVLWTEIGLISISAQTFTLLHSFSPSTDGARPEDGLVLVGNTLFGTTSASGASNNGTIFAINTDGSGFTNLCNLPTAARSPFGALVSSGPFLYGTGAGAQGSVFRIQTNGSDFTHLQIFSVFSSSNGLTPQSQLVLSDNILYGTTDSGGTSSGANQPAGTIFKISADGTGFTNLHRFAEIPLFYPPNFIRNPELLLSGNFLYGVTHIGGAHPGSGTIYKINTNGSEFAVLHHFSPYPGGLTNFDGARPMAGLAISDNILYGTTRHGGAASKGTIFSIKTDGTGFTKLYDFSGNEGYDIQGKLLLSGNTLYGTAILGGVSSNGTIFSINTDGTDFQTLYTFSAGSGFSTEVINSDGARPKDGLILLGDKLYGTTSVGGTNGSGTIFSLTLPPNLTVKNSGTDIILQWATNFTGYTLQSTTNLTESPIWTSDPLEPSIMDSQNTVTNSISGTQKYYRLSD